MKIVVAPNAFKGTLTARTVAGAIAAGIRCVKPDTEIAILPVADGGDGTLDTLIDAFGGVRRSAVVSGPLGEPVEAEWGIIRSGQVALIEGAAAFGLALVPEGRCDPGLTTSRGVGDLIVSALDLGVRDFLLAIGGSANNDGGMGMLRALGIRFMNSGGNELEEGGLALAHLDKIDTSRADSRLSDSTFQVLCDSTVPLTGPTGVSIMYSPGKGGSLEVATGLEQSLRRYAQVVREQYGHDMEQLAGAGSGGGVVGAAEVFLNARVRLGIEFILDALEFRTEIEGAHLVVTGEGQIDEQTIYDKGPIGVAKMARYGGVPVLAICAVMGPGWQGVLDEGIEALAIVAEPGGWAQPGTVVTEQLLTESAADVFGQLVASGFPRPGSLQHGHKYSRSGDGG